VGFHALLMKPYTVGSLGECVGKALKSR